VTPETSRTESPAPRRGAAKAVLPRILLAVGSVLFVLFLIEFLAFIHVVDAREVLGNNFAWWPIYNVNDPELIHIRRPNVHFSGKALGGSVTAYYRIPQSDMTLYQWDDQYDHNGFRNATDLKSADILLIGDSFVEGLTIPYDQLGSSLLANLQGKVVANLGQSAYGPQQELVILRRYGLPLQPRTVVWMFSEGTDLSDVVYYDRVMHSPPNLWQAYLQRSFLHMLLLRLKARPNPPGIIRAGYFQAASGKPVTIYFQARWNPLTAENLGALDETVQIVSEANRLCAAQGARFIFVFVPEKFTVLHSFCRFPPESECSKWAGNDMAARFQKALAAVSPDIGYLDLTPALVSASKNGVLTYYPDDPHWTPEGHRIAAEAIDAYLKSTQETQTSSHAAP